MPPPSPQRRQWRSPHGRPGARRPCSDHRRLQWHRPGDGRRARRPGCPRGAARARREALEEAAAEARAAGAGRAVVCPVDVNDEARCSEAVDGAVARFGRLTSWSTRRR